MHEETIDGGINDEIEKSLRRDFLAPKLRAILRITGISLGARLKEQMMKTSLECDRETELGPKWNGK